MSDPQDWRAFALLLIDVQQDFWPDETAQAFPDFEAHITRLCAFCRTSGIDIIHIRAQFEPDQSDWMAKYRVSGSIPCIRGTAGAGLLPCAQELPGEKVLIKQTFDAFLQPELLSHLRRHNKRFILTAGLVTSVCVLLTTASAAQQGFLTAMVEDCCADDPECHAHTLEQYPFIFECTTVDRLSTNYSAWMDELNKLSNHGGRP